MKTKSLFFILALAFFLTPFSSNVFAQKTVTIEGNIMLHDGIKLPEGGASVVLLAFEPGVPMRGPQARIMSDPSGKFRFENVPQRLKATYRIGSRVGGKLHSSDAFNLKADSSVVSITIHVTKNSAQASGRATPQGIVAPKQEWTGKRVSIAGNILMPEGETFPEAGASVVLLKFTMDANGKVQMNGPQARIKSDGSGKFRFEGVPQEFKVAYRLGTRIGGDLYSSALFSMRPNAPVLKVDIVIPGFSKDASQLKTVQSNLFLEQAIGGVNLTEVLNIRNGSKDRIDTRQNAMLIALPQGFTKFKAINGLSEGQYSTSNVGLKITRIFPQDVTQIVFQYTIPVLFGRVQINKNYNIPLKEIQVLTPKDALSIESPELGFSGERQGNSMTFLAWKGTSENAGVINLNISGVPIKPIYYGVLTIATFLLLMIAVLIFLRMRLYRTNE